MTNSTNKLSVHTHTKNSDWLNNLLHFVHSACDELISGSIILGHSHCSYLDIYISRKIRLCVIYLEGKISNQPTGQTPQLFGLEIQIYYTHFSSIFFRSCQIQCFLHTVAAILRWSIHMSRIFASNHNSNISTLQNSSEIVQKALDLRNPAQNRRKSNIINVNFQTKKMRSLACRLV